MKNYKNIGLVLAGVLFLHPIKAQIINIEDKRVRLGDSIAWKGYVDLSFNIYKNNNLTTLSRFSTQVERNYKRHFVMLLLGHNLFKSEQQNFLNDGFSHLRYNFDFKPQVKVEVYAQAQYNQRTNMALRTLLGTGLRFKVQPRPNKRFYIGVSYMYETNVFRTNDAVAYNHRLSQYLSYNIQLPQKSRLVHTTYFQPKISQWHNNRVASELSLLFYLTSKMVFRATASAAYDNDPILPASVPDLTYSILNGFRIEF